MLALLDCRLSLVVEVGSLVVVVALQLLGPGLVFLKSAFDIDDIVVDSGDAVQAYSLRDGKKAGSRAMLDLKLLGTLSERGCPSWRLREDIFVAAVLAPPVGCR